MIDFLNRYGQLWAEYFGLAIVQNTLFLVMIFIILYRLRNASAHVRYVVCLIALFKLLLPPFIPAHLSFSSSEQLRPLTEGFFTITFNPLPASAGISSPQPVQLNLFGLIFVLWAGVVFLYLLFSLISTCRLVVLLRNATPLSDEVALEAIRDQNMQICKSERIAMPLTVGVLPGKIFVPNLWDQWTQDCRRMVMRHEMAHIKRYDGLFQVFQIATQALYFFHPLVLLLNRWLKEYREMACDDATIGFERHSFVEYSRCLVEIAEKMVQNPVTCESASTLMRQKNELLKRVRYQIKGGDMSHLSKKKICAMVVGLIALILPLSWYYSGATSEEHRERTPRKEVQTAPTVKSVVEDSTQLKPPKEKRIIDALKMRYVEVSIRSDNEIRINGEETDLEYFSRMLREKVTEDNDKIVVDIVSDEDVMMGMIYNVQRILREMGIMRVRYKNDSGKGMPLVIPPLDIEEKLSKIPEELITALIFNALGEVFIDKENVHFANIQELIEKRLSQNDKIVITIQIAEDMKYRDFLKVLEQVRKAGASRIVIKPPSAPDERSPQ